MLDEEMKSIMEEAAKVAGATYISPGLSQVCRDFVEEAFKHKVEYRRDILVADLVEFMQEQALERFIRGGVQVVLGPPEVTKKKRDRSKRPASSTAPVQAPPSLAQLLKTINQRYGPGSALRARAK